MGRVPVSLPPSRWAFDPTAWPSDDAVAVGAELEPSTILAAYRRGAFPMPLDDVVPMVWWSPLRRGVLRPAALVLPRSLRRSRRRYQVRIDTAFEQVVNHCADPRRDGGWISADIRAAYVRLHGLGWAHSVETFDQAGVLVGGLYGLAIGGLFAGESMFHHATDASKVALIGLVEALRDEHLDQRLIDVQWRTPHLATLGAEAITRADYLARLPRLLDLPLPAAFDA
ncbi:MAG: leucyl/phenylalanyl-tRNA--protein transferase [Nocardioidaceae bacterium]|nr:leucyl/phenylalanyl-tRNA--protein transferase [Nocardioidaceae bacterium]